MVYRPGEKKEVKTITDLDWSALDDSDDSVEVEEIKQGDSTVYVNNTPVDTRGVKFNSFAIPEQIKKGLFDKGYAHPSEIQASSIQLILDDSLQNKNLVVQAPSGSGKTLPISIALLHRVDASKNYIQSICICPTRRLAIQNYKYVCKIASFSNIKVAIGMDEHEDGIDGFTKDRHVIIGTPGFLSKKGKEIRGVYSKVTSLVLDNADDIIQSHDLSSQAKYIKQFCPKNVRIQLFSATFAEELDKFINNFAPNADQIRSKRDEVILKNILQYYLVCQTLQDKYTYLREIYEMVSVDQTIMFTQTREMANRIQVEMNKLDPKPNVAVLHGKLEEANEDKIINSFNDGIVNHLIATNAFARDINTPAVNLVINFEIPVKSNSNEIDYSTYINCIGRGGRWENKGVAISFVLPGEVGKIQKIAEHFRWSIKEIKPNEFMEIDERIEELKAKSGPK